MFVNPAIRRTPPPSGMKVLLPLAALALLAGCQRADEALQPEIRPVRAITIESRAASGMASLTGVVQAQTEINESFRIDGRLVERTVDIGDSVKPGQLIARLDPQNEESSLQAARAQLAAARAQLVEARSNHARMRELVAEDAVSRASFDQAVAVLKTTESQVEAVQSQVSLAENRLSYTRLMANVAGVVTARGPEPGEVVAAGRMIVQVAREGARDAVFDVPGRIKDIAPRNPEITVALADDPRVTAAGRVREVAPRADPVTGTFAVRVRLIDPPPAMRLGSTVTGKMQLPEALAIEVPASALVRADGKVAVWVVDQASSTVSLRNVQLGGGDANTVQVAAGLNPGDVVVTAGVQALRPGQKVRVPEARP
ncbi:MAG: Multidrug transporter MdtA [Candidatus Accumulibacter adjunctus]|uniref:Multidrug transporter MdtA n=1 Tax=Candidatus Accumulibacter adjunctus TaxID=1454001 RepID=A0A011NYP7_9PROT|nr:MAG: Multidrug transporter MdtA [Candidatus Accumulibacter adjunctus]